MTEHTAELDAPSTDCMTCGRSAKDCNDGHAKGWDGCCLTCDARGRLVSHRLHLTRVTPPAQTAEKDRGLQTCPRTGCEGRGRPLWRTHERCPWCHAALVAYVIPPEVGQ